MGIKVGFVRESNVAGSIKSDSDQSYLPCEDLSLSVICLAIELCCSQLKKIRKVSSYSTL